MDGMPASDEVDPRIERSRHHVLTAAVERLREVGSSRLTIEAVAARSGVAKSTIYRHWAGTAELVTDAFLTLKPRSAEPPPGPVRARVAALLTGIVESLNQPTNLACVMPALIDAAERVPEMRRSAAGWPCRARCRCGVSSTRRSRRASCPRAPTAAC